MKKLYVVSFDGKVRGVFSSLEKAQQYCALNFTLIQEFQLKEEVYRSYFKGSEYTDSHGDSCFDEVPIEIQEFVKDVGEVPAAGKFH